MPVSSDRSTTSRAWKRVNDARPDAIIIRVPRDDWVQPSLVRRILRQAIRAELSVARQARLAQDMETCTMGDIMIIHGEIEEKDGRYAALLEPLGIYAQGATRAAACAALARTILELAADYGPLRGFKVDVSDDGKSTAYVTSSDPARLIALLLRRQRELHGMSLADVAIAMGAKSRNGFAQYEQARFEPSISKLDEMLAAIAPELVVAIVPRTARVLPRWDEEAGDTAELDRVLEDPTPENIEALRRASRPLKPTRAATKRRGGRQRERAA
jgi:transcriptional regulator with XRE-family HTH domain